VQEILFQCNDPAMKGSGTVRIEALDSENVKGTTEINGSMDGTHNTTIKSSFTAHRIGSDCGDVKPANSGH